MPTYEYVCVAGHEFQAFQRISDKPKSKCPACGRKAERRISGGSGFLFKGTGFYITDYGKDGKGARKPEAAEAAPASGGDAKAEAPAPKAEAPAEKPAKASKKKPAA
ncbi:MAG: zinc ribbon domain-containing protein [Gemmatimonadales bacterium]|nr:zinc ribbon domain-containing protein [Gemmatimonadales bacterium]